VLLATHLAPLYRTADVSEYRPEENCNGWSVVPLA
jgi:hypothetical protein